jgi:flagellar motor switch protein FliG
LSPETAAAVVAAGGAQFARRAVIDLAAGITVNTAAGAAIAATLQAELINPLDAELRGKEPPPAVCDLVNALPSSLRSALFEDLAARAPDMAKALRAALVTFEDLPARAPAAAAPLIVKELDRETLLLAVKHGRVNSPATVKFLFDAISKRLVEEYEQDLAAMPEPSETAGEGAQRKVMAVVRRLVAAGAFKMAAPPASD